MPPSFYMGGCKKEWGGLVPKGSNLFDTLVIKLSNITL